MKISKEKLKQIIAEEVAKMDEVSLFGMNFGRGAGADRLKGRRRPKGRPASAGADFDTKKLAALDSSADMETFGKGLKGKYSDAYDSAASYSDFKDQKQDSRIDQSDDALYTKLQRLEKALNDMDSRIADLQQATGEAPPEDMIPTAGMEVEEPKTMAATKRAEKQALRKQRAAARAAKNKPGAAPPASFEE